MFMNTLPTELIYEIKNFLDDKTKLKLDISLNFKQDCCKEQEKDYYHLCCICNNYICEICYEKSNVFFDDCYFCNKTFCSECNNSDNDLLDLEYMLSICSYDDCYYCYKGSCFRNEMVKICNKCKFNKN